MERENDRAATGRDARRQHVVEHRFQLAEFIVDGDSQRLEDARRRVASSAAPSLRRGDAAAVARHGVEYEVRQLPGGFDRLLFPPGDEGRGDLAGLRLFAVIPQDGFEFIFGCIGQQLRRGPAFGGLKSQIERTVAVETEPAAFVGKLVRRQPQVEQHTIDEIDMQFVQYGPKLCVGRRDEVNVLAGQDLRRANRHLRIAVESDQQAVRLKEFQDVSGMPAGADRAVRHSQAGAKIEKLKRFPNQHRLMHRPAKFAAGRRSGRHNGPQLAPKDEEEW